MPLKRVFLALGSNLGDREQNLRNSITAIEREHIRVLARSSIYETAPQDIIDQPWFLNMVIECQTRTFPLQLLATLLRIERELGRVRTNSMRRGPRVIDLDILLFGETIMNAPELVLPHPRMLQRRFVLEPLVEIAPELRHPETKQVLRNVLQSVRDQPLRRFTAGN
jgi:2-amino-4-hydroxy-6-hydroxymethyldihydropteridine diphosphokinase